MDQGKDSWLVLAGNGLRLHGIRQRKLWNRQKLVWSNCRNCTTCIVFDARVLLDKDIHLKRLEKAKRILMLRNTITTWASFRSKSELFEICRATFFTKGSTTSQEGVSPTGCCCGTIVNGAMGCRLRFWTARSEVSWNGDWEFVCPWIGTFRSNFAR